MSSIPYRFLHEQAHNTDYDRNYPLRPQQVQGIESSIDERCPQRDKRQDHYGVDGKHEDYPADNKPDDIHRRQLKDCRKPPRLQIAYRLPHRRASQHFLHHQSYQTPRDEHKQRLREIRQEANLRQVDVAKRLRLPQSFVSKYESGERRLEFVEVAQVCAALGVGFSTFVQRFEDGA